MDTRKHRKLDDYLLTAGYTFGYRDLVKFMLIISGIVTAATYVTFLITSAQETSVGYWLYLLLAHTLVGYPLVLLLGILIFYVYTDLIIANRKASIEKVLPEFLQLTSANIRAGLPVDQALWSSIRPQFGILAKEIETVAKQTMVGKDLGDALNEFADKYDSRLLKRTVSLIVEGIEAGSEIGDLLENTALNIQDIQIKRESMAANVTSYSIFISVAVLFAAPLLFAVSMQMLRIVHSLSGTLEGTGGGAMGIAISLSTEAVRESDFFVFCIVSLILTSIMSNVIISAIKTGHAREAVKNIPVYIAVTLVIFFIAQWVLSFLFGGLF